ncbi:MAG: murein hydrolase activator EnvC [Thermoanaerobaculales bacterium]
MRRSFGAVLIAGGLLAAGGFASAAAGPPTGVQLDAVRNRIHQLELRLDRLAAEAENAERERNRLDAQLELADARVREVELLLEHSSSEAKRLRAEAAELTAELDGRRDALNLHLEIMALLGQPGPLQLLFDAFRGGEMEAAVGTVAVLTAGQVRLVEEYRELRQQHNARLAALSRTLAEAQAEASNLERRHDELERVRRMVASRLQKLEKSQQSTGASLADLHERESALERLIVVLSSRERLTGNEDIRRFRGALPWPVEGPVILGFGRHYLPKYATYTVCNGLRFSAPSNVPVNAVFPGIVAYARHFKGYGNMVVLDHGHGVYSLVAGLATIHVRLDQRVKMGTRLGLASPPAENGNIYLEFRVGEEPEDPRRWLQLKGGSS